MFFVNAVFITACGIEIQQTMRVGKFHLIITLNMANTSRESHWLYFRGKLFENRYQGSLIKKKARRRVTWKTELYQLRQSPPH